MPDNPDATIKKSKRVVCKYCGRPIKQGNSINQGCGEICRQKHRNARYRVIGLDRKEVSSFERFNDQRPESSVRDK